MTDRADAAKAEIAQMADEARVKAVGAAMDMFTAAGKAASIGLPRVALLLARAGTKLCTALNVETVDVSSPDPARTAAAFVATMEAMDHG